jgi:hypothetical protein
LVISAVFLGLNVGVATAADPRAQDPFAGAPYRIRESRTGRISSWDRDGGDADSISFKPGETKELAKLDGRA